MNNQINTTYLEDINFNNLDFINAKIKKYRQVFFDKKEEIVYKFFNLNWEWADNVEKAFSLDYYNTQLIPNFHSLIKDEKGNNRGYITFRYDKESSFEFYNDNKNFNYIYRVINKIIPRQILPKRILVIKHLITLLDSIITKSIDNNIIYVAISIDHTWRSSDGYHIIDLESIRDLDWLLNIDNNDPECIRKLLNRNNFNKQLKQLIEAHNLKCPPQIFDINDLKLFMPRLYELNDLKFS